MAYRRVPFAVGEWYHCYSRGIDKRITFESEQDCRRFLQLLYLANDTSQIDRSHFSHRSHKEIFQRARKEQIVSIGAFCLMRNHYHLLMQEILDDGISRFMQKVGTGYSMYFNEKYKRIGNVFVKPFRSKHVGSDRYLRRVAQYIHLNPIEKFEPSWKSGKIKNFATVETALLKYPFSSLMDYKNSVRPEGTLLDKEAVSLLRDGMPPLRSVIQDAAEYYATLKS